MRVYTTRGCVHQNFVREEKRKLRTFMGGTTAGKPSSPEASTDSPSCSTLFSSCEAADIEPHIADAVLDLAVLHQKRSVTSHAREQVGVGVDVANVPDARHENAAVCGSHHVVDGSVATCHHQVDRIFVEHSMAEQRRGRWA